jgi:folate-dependent phosphoribosylglycinamide formyltransferase PurN
LGTTTCSNLEILLPGKRRPHRVVVLCTDDVMTRHTCATLLRAGVNLVGVVNCARTGRARVAFLLRWTRRRGFWRTTGQILGRAYDRAMNARQDLKLLRTMIDDVADREAIRRAGIPTVQTDSYSRPATIEAIRRLDPDIFVVHAKCMVGPKVRALAPVAVIGGHPGITPHYRGAYSPFWALSHGRPDMVGFTVFLLDNGIDTGPVLVQGTVPINRGEDSHLTLAWKGMLRQCELQGEVIGRLDAGEGVPFRRIVQVPENSEFGPPTLGDVLWYRRVQQVVR